MMTRISSVKTREVKHYDNNSDNSSLLQFLVIWLCFSVVFLITAVQSFIYDRKREKREREQASFVTLNITKIA